MKPYTKNWASALLAFVGMACPSSAIVDKDGDGMSDVWESHYGLDAANNGDNDPNENPATDLDGDGWSNLDETIAGTDPSSGVPPMGFLQARITHSPLVPGVFMVSWSTVLGKQYRLWASPSLQTGSWTQVGDPEIGDGTPIEVAIDLTGNPTPPAKLFWRVSVDDVDQDEDGLTDFEEGLIGSSSILIDTDNDGITDAGEFEQGSSPINAVQTPAADWFVLRGTGAQDEVKTQTKKFIIKGGESAILVIGTQSDEYPQYTDQESEFDDIVSWEASSPEETILAESLHVNDRHIDWVIDAANHYQLNGITPVHLESIKTIFAPPGNDLTITVTLSATNIGDAQRPSTALMGLLPVKFEIVHYEKLKTEDGEEIGFIVNPGANVLLRDEIADLKIKIPTINNTDWELNLDLDAGAIKSESLDSRGAVQMYDFGEVNNGTITPLTVDPNFATEVGPYNIKLTNAKQGEETFKVVVNKNGDFNFRLKNSDNRIDVTSRQFSVTKRIRKYARVSQNGNVDYDKHDNYFDIAGQAWGAFYQNPVDSDILKAIGFQETQLGYQSNEHIDIMTVGNPGDHILDAFHRQAPYNTEKEAIPDAGGLNGFAIRFLDYPAAKKTTVKDAIYWGTCWLYHKAQKGKFASAPGNPPFDTRFTGWNSWDTAVSFYGPNTSYLGLVEGPWKRGKKDSTGIYLWPILTHQKARK